MKAFKFLILMSLTALALTNARAQTNAVTFPQLLSVSNSVLMTDAEFRCTVGSKLFFQSGDDEHGFEADSLDTNVLSKLGLTLDGLKEDQAKLDAKKHMAAAEYQKWLANRALQEKQAADAEAAANAADGTSTTSNTSTNSAAGGNSPKPAHKHKPHIVAGG